MGKTVDEYIAGLDGWRADAVTQLREIVREAAPEASEAVKWAQPIYESNGPFCYIKAFKNHVNIGFWRGVDLDDPHVLLQGDGEKMRHIKIGDVNDIPGENIRDFVQAAVKLNQTKGDPTKGQ
ncbi:MAG: DUF1801 domain-containing protein [Chloroflexi bacterium]|nr:DUF1801 domain-containing protein [Chloroflexota bacterium]